MPNFSKLFDLTNRVAIVTGGAGLLGAEFCRTLVMAGARVVVADIDMEAAKSLALSLTDLPSKVDQRSNMRVKSSAIGTRTDVTDINSVQDTVDTTLKQFGRLDILINSAAMDPKFDPLHTEDHSNAFEDYPLEAWDQALDVNLTGMFLCCQAAVRPMLAQGQGVIINVCSIYGMVGPDQKIYQRDSGVPQYKPVYYSVTKAGVLGLTKYLATYYAGKNIRVNALSPGGVFNQHDDEFVQAYATRVPMERMAEKDEMNGAILFLASDASAYMTGSNLVVDGGWTAW
jgi:2-deoxy-D-gluconate 3-dehydrogenase